MKDGAQPHKHTHTTVADFLDSLISGYWTVNLLTLEGERLQASAKFTFIYEATHKGLKIKLLNSGLTPTGIVPVEEDAITPKEVKAAVAAFQATLETASVDDTVALWLPGKFLHSLCHRVKRLTFRSPRRGTHPRDRGRARHVL